MPRRGFVEAALKNPKLTQQMINEGRIESPARERGEGSETLAEYQARQKKVRENLRVKNVPLFDPQEREVKGVGPAWWNEPCLGPPDQKIPGYTPGELINQEALMMNKGTSGPVHKGKVDAPWEPVIKEQALEDADFHNVKGNDIRKGTDMHLGPWQRNAGPKELH